MSTEEDEVEFEDCVEGPITIDGNGEIKGDVDILSEKDPEVESIQHVFTKLNHEEIIEVDPSNSKENEENWGTEEYPKELDEALQIDKDINKALESKEEGNKFFRLKDYDVSIQHYTYAISYCPETPEYSEQLATFYGNRSAAYFAVEEWELVIEDCTDALNLKPAYSKVLARRMQCYDKLQKYEEALADAKQLKELEPTYPKIDSIIARLQRLYDEKMAKMKDEALGKLKELGNSLLGNFGMSLDNFKMVQDPNTGGWSISMNNNK